MKKTGSRRRVWQAVMLLAVVMLAGCGNNQKQENSSGNPSPAASSSSAQQANEKEAELKLIFPGDKPTAMDEVWGAVSDYVKQKGINVTFDIQYIPFNDYKDKLLVMSAAGDMWDLNFDGDWLAYQQMAGKGAYMALNELLPEYAPNLYKKYEGQGSLQAASVNGQIVSLPWTMKQNTRPFGQWRSDVTDKLGIGAAKDSVQTIEAIDELLRRIKQADPTAKITRKGPLDLFKLKHELMDIGFSGYVVDLNDPQLRAVPIEQTAAYRESAQLAKTWYDDGIISSDAMVDKEGIDVQWRNGKLVFDLSTHEWTNADPGFSDPSFKRESSILYPDKKYANRSPLANVVAINKKSKNPDKVLRFLDLLETDKQLYDLVQYGIDGKTYKLDGQAAAFPDGMDSSTSSYMGWTGQWALWKPQFMRPTGTYSDGFWLKEGEFASQPMNVNSPLDGLFISQDDIKNEVAKRESIKSEFGLPIEFGTVKNADKAVDDYIAKQQAAGVDKITAEVQKQIDQFLAGKKQ